MDTRSPAGGVFAAGLLPNEIAAAFGLSPEFRGRQVFSWVAKGAASFADMSDLPASERERLSRFELHSSSVDGSYEAQDGSVKLRIRLRDGAAVEAVLLSDREERLTACLSVQVGCGMACAFCKTGTLGLLRNLGPDEIVEQLIALARLRGRPSNIVFMGMGEPLHNLENVRRAIAVICHPAGFGLSKRKVTISTCGVVPGILDLAERGPYVRLAVSLTAAENGLRSALMPVNKAWDLSSLREALGKYQERSGDRITLEAALMAGENDTPEAAEAMADWIGSLDAQVNVIPWNPVAGLPYREPSRAALEAFQAVLERRGINVVRRARRGRGVSGACGQLGDTLGADRA